MSIGDEKGKQGFAIVSLVMGIVALIMAIIPCTSVLAVLLGIISIIFGSLSLYKASNNTPKGLGISGLVLGILSLLLSLFWVFFIVRATSPFRQNAIDIFNVQNNNSFDIDITEDTLLLDTTLIRTRNVIEIKTYTEEFNDTVN